MIVQIVILLLFFVRVSAFPNDVPGSVFQIMYLVLHDIGIAAASVSVSLNPVLQWQSGWET
jgi:hypothetical protein